MALVVPRFSRSARRLGQGVLLAVAAFVTLSLPAHMEPVTTLGQGRHLNPEER